MAKAAKPKTKPAKAVKPAADWPAGTKVKVVSGVHVGKHGDVLSFDQEHQRLYILVAGGSLGSPISVPTAWCRR